ncbi:von Willebrand factor type A domain-containing protein [Luteolibacter pohnpeiensis]|uniref:von Willebrand factor type A domain-containing protein n=1 Tax=Luteolibacter pohnpeiensis TaxID=454153 RepID=A0A934VUW9_9BACT|nr:von Willebrand factor type A domain-containing protein [Luteolibacter pohnpeiensis]MBK1880939.1 von Willebrand factor type A domain-containing protein [Luteolibacter pohnpeiensis]
MTLTPEDPRLTSYLLGELSPEEAAAVEKAVAEDPKLQAALSKFDDIRELIGDSLMRNDYQLHADQQDAVRRSAVLADRTRKLTPAPVAVRKFPIKPVLIALGTVAVVVILGAVIFGGSKDQPVASSGSPEASTPDESVAAPALPKFAIGPDNPSGFSAAPVLENRPDEAEFPPLLFRNPIAASESPVLSLPIRSGHTSLDWVSNFIHQNSKLPPVNSVRIEEFLNAFELLPAGSAAIAKGVSLSAEAISCPWKPSAVLLIVSLRGAPNANHEVTASFRADPTMVSHYRLLGYSPMSGEGKDLPMTTQVPAKSMVTLALVIEPQGVAKNFGTLDWTVDHESAPAVPMVFNPSNEPSDDARFAALVCTYGQWLAGDQRGIIDTEIVAAMAREVASESISPERYSFLELIDRSLSL